MSCIVTLGCAAFKYYCTWPRQLGVGNPGTPSSVSDGKENLSLFASSKVPTASLDYTAPSLPIPKLHQMERCGLQYPADSEE